MYRPALEESSIRTSVERSLDGADTSVRATTDGLARATGRGIIFAAKARCHGEPKEGFGRPAQFPERDRGRSGGTGGGFTPRARATGGSGALRYRRGRHRKRGIPRPASRCSPRTIPAPISWWTFSRRSDSNTSSPIPGSSFRGLHESVVNYGGNKNPEFITCCHEESSVAMAHGYSKIEGKPVCVFAHGTVGLQHASMAVYNAYVDRAPVFMVIGNTVDAATRRPGVEWAHSVQDAGVLVRDFTKWDDMPVSLQHFAESAVRAYKIATTPPTMPVLLVADGDLQETPMRPGERPHIPKITLASPPQGDSGAVAEAARLLVAAENPVIVADRCARTPAGLKLLVELAETLQAPVINQYGRMNFPSAHPLNQTERSRTLIANADVILGLEVWDFWGTVQ